MKTHRWLIGGLIAAAAVLALLAGLIFGWTSTLETADSLASVTGAIAGLVSVFATLVALQIAAKSSRDASISGTDLVAGHLARTARMQWRDEVVARGLTAESRIRVSWSSSDARLAARPSEILGAGYGNPLRLRLHGDISDVAQAWRQLPSSRLVILGKPGSGKTSLAVVLIDAALEVWKEGDPIPVLVSIQSWNPSRDSASSWLIKMLMEQYAVLRERPETAAQLVQERRISPVLDGLDEMPAELHAQAMLRLHEFAADGQAVVLTCRSEHYRDLIERGSAPLPRAAVVELENVERRSALAYLSAGQQDGYRKWKSVADEVRERPTGVLARTLNNPLMLTLARDAYLSPHSDPAEMLLAQTEYDLREQLFNSYLAAVYSLNPNGATYSPGQARRWLSYFAQHLQRQGKQDLAWWDIVQEVPFQNFIRRSIPVTFALTFGLILFPYGFILAIVALFTHSKDPRIPRRGLWFLISRTALGAVTGALIGYLIDSAYLPPNTLSFTILLPPIFMLAGAATRGIRYDPHIQVVEPRKLLRADRFTFFQYVLTIALSTALIVITTMTWAYFSLIRPDEENFDISPEWAAPLIALLIVSTTLIFGSALALASGVFGALALGYGSAWIGLGIARCWLAPRSQIPWHVMSFLDDAYYRGVLRRVGPVYQFRHEQLRAHLAAVKAK